MNVDKMCPALRRQHEESSRVVAEVRLHRVTESGIITESAEVVRFPLSHRDVNQAAEDVANALHPFRANKS